MLEPRPPGIKKLRPDTPRNDLFAGDVHHGLVRSTINRDDRGFPRELKRRLRQACCDSRKCEEGHHCDCLVPCDHRHLISSQGHATNASLCAAEIVSRTFMEMKTQIASLCVQVRDKGPVVGPGGKARLGLIGFVREGLFRPEAGSQTYRGGHGMAGTGLSVCGWAVGRPVVSPAAAASWAVPFRGFPGFQTCLWDAADAWRGLALLDHDQRVSRDLRGPTVRTGGSLGERLLSLIPHPAPHFPQSIGRVLLARRGVSPSRASRRISNPSSCIHDR